jgi:hypothetical protein
MLLVEAQPSGPGGSGGLQVSRECETAFEQGPPPAAVPQAEWPLALRAE